MSSIPYQFFGCLQNTWHPTSLLCVSLHTANKSISATPIVLWSMGRSYFNLTPPILFGGHQTLLVPYFTTLFGGGGGVKKVINNKGYYK